MAAALAVATARSMKRAANAAAPSAPSAGARRVLARPGSGALARMAIATGSGLPWCVAIGARQPGRVRPHEVGESQTPHEQNRPRHAMLFPSPPRGHDGRGDTERTADSPEA